MKFNEDKFWVLHLELNNAGHRYRLGDEYINNRSTESGLGADWFNKNQQ